MDNVWERARARYAQTPVPEELSFLDSLYDFIHVGKPVKVEKILEEYTYSMTDKRLKRLMADLGRSMEEDGITKEVVSGLFGGKSSYVPNQEAVELVIDKVRAEMLEEGTVTEEVAALIVLLRQIYTERQKKKADRPDAYSTEDDGR